MASGSPIGNMIIAVDLDSSGVNKSMTGLRRQMKSVNTEMRANLSSFSRSEKSAEKYGVMIDGLTKRQKLQATAVEEARKEYEEMVKQHGENSAKAEGAANKLNEQIALYEETGRELSNLTSEFEEFQKQQDIQASKWHKVGTSMEGIGNKLKSVGGNLQEAGKKLTKFSALVVGGVAAVTGGLFAMTTKATEAADVIAKGAKRMNVSTDFYQEMTYWASQNGIEHGQMEKAVGRFNQRMGMAQNGNEKYASALQQMGVDMDAVRDGTLSTDDAFAQSIQTLSEMENEQDKVNLATEMFGTKMARDLLPALNDGSLSMEDARKKAEELGLVMSQDQLEAAEAFQDAQDDIKRSMAAVGMQIGLDLMPHFQRMFDWILEHMPAIRETIFNAFEGIVDKVTDLVNWFKDLSPTMKKAIAGFTGLGLAIGPILLIIGKLTSGLGGIFLAISPLLKGVAKAGGLFKILGGVFATLTSPVGLIVGAIALLTAGFVLLYKKSDTFRNFIHKLGASLKQVFQKIMTAIQPMIDKIVGFFQDNIPKLIEGIKNVISSVGEFIKPVINAIVSFFEDVISKLKSFWDKEGKQIVEAVKNIGNIISTVMKAIWSVVDPIVKSIWKVIQWAFDKILATIDFVMPAVLFIIKTVWGNIKGVITGALDVIMGVVKVFTGLFTGDFSKMWEGVKQIFTGAIKAVWNYIQLLFVGRILKGIGSFVRLFGGLIKSMWTSVRSVFSTVIKWIVEFVKNRFTAMSNTISTITTTIRNVISRIWNAILSFFRNIIKSIVDFVKQRFTNLKNNVTNIFTGIRDMAKRVWNKTKDNIVNPIKNGVNWAIKKFKGFKDSVSTTFKNIKDNVFGYVSDMIQKIKDMPGNMKKGIENGAGKVKDGMLEIGRKMVDGMVSGANGVIAGVNWVLEKFNASTLDTVKAKSLPGVKNWYAHGTKGAHPGGPAVVGDGKGSNAGSELMQDPKGNFSLSPAKPTLIPNMPRGTQVWSATETREALTPQYAWGINFKDVAKALNLGGGALKYSDSKKGQTIGKLSSGVGTAFDVYNEAPKALLNAGLKAMGVEVPNFPAAIGKMAKGGFNYVKDKAVGFIKKTQDDELESMAGPVSGGASAWRSHIRKAAARMNESITSRHVNGIIAQINRESGGNEKITQSPQVVDVNTLAGNPARGLLQYIPQTFSAYKMPGHGNIYSGYDQLLAFFNNKNWRKDLPYGTRGWGPTGVRKFATGGLIKKKQLAMLAEDGHPEMVIPTDPKRRSDAMKLLALTGKMLGVGGDDQGSVRPNRLPNVNNSGQSEEVAYLKKSVELLTELVLSSRNIENKPVLSEGDIKRSYDKMDSRESTKHDVFSGRLGGAY